MSIYSPTIRYLCPERYYSLKWHNFKTENSHQHSRCEIMYILSGVCTIQAEEKRFELSHGQYIFLDENIPHSLEICDPRGCSMMNIEFSCSSCKPDKICADMENVRRRSASVRKFLREKRPYFIASERELFGYVIKDLIYQMEHWRPHNDFLIENLMERLLCELADAAQMQKQPGTVIHVRRAVSYIQAHYTQEIRVQQIADAAEISRSYLQLLFRNEFHCGVMDYVSHLRIQRAKFLLSNTSMRITDIAIESGFNSRQNFALSFEKAEALSPAEFRKAAAFHVEAPLSSFAE